MDFKKKMKKFFTLTRKADGGFTLVELIVVIAILAVLAGITVPAYGNYVEKAKITADEQTLATMNTAFTVACMDNGEYDMTNLSFSPKATGLQTHVTVNGEVNDAFQVYFGGGTFQYFNDGDVTFSSAAGKFIINSIEAIKEALKNSWGGSSFADDEGIVEMLLQTFDGIGGFFGSAPDGQALKDFILNNVSTELADAMGLSGILDGYISSTTLSDEELDAYLEKYNEEYAALSEEERAAWRAAEENKDVIATIKGNAGVLHFAQDAAGRDVEDVMSSVESFMTILEAKDDETELTQADYIAYYESTLSGAELEAFRAKSDDAKYEEVKNEFLKYNDPDKYGYAVDLGDLDLTADDVVRMSKAAESVGTNNAGVSTLGSMYALTAGYFNSGYYEQSDFYKETGIEIDPSTLTYSEFGTVLSALQMDNFQDYYEANGQSDLQTYLDFMEYASTNQDVDMTDSNAFAGLSDYINGALK